MAAMTLFTGASGDLNSHWWQYPLMVLWFGTIPGMILAMFVGRNVHDVSLWVAAVFNAVIYGYIAFYFVKRRSRRAASAR
jgi:uncharacterized membrane protein YdjX (TVP38/TMEM64 family)